MLHIGSRCLGPVGRRTSQRHDGQMYQCWSCLSSSQWNVWVAPKSPYRPRNPTGEPRDRAAGTLPILHRRRLLYAVVCPRKIELAFPNNISECPGPLPCRISGAVTVTGISLPRRRFAPIAPIESVSGSIMPVIKRNGKLWTIATKLLSRERRLAEPVPRSLLLKGRLWGTRGDLPIARGCAGTREERSPAVHNLL